MARSGVRTTWDDVPAGVRAAVDSMLGSDVVTAINLPGGFSPGPAARCTLTDGRVVFVKAAGTALNPRTPSIHRREAAVLAALPEAHPSPGLIGVVDDGDWVALAVEWVEGWTPRPPLTRGDVDRFVALSTRLAEEGAGVRPDGVAPIEADDEELFGHWACLAGDPPDRRDRLDGWARAHLDRLAELECDAPDAASGDTLLHLDLRIDNVVFSAAGADRDIVVDWPGAAIGAAWVDIVGLAPSLALDGGPAPEELIAVHPLTAAADADAVTAVLAAFAGFFTRLSLFPDPPGLPTVRAFQAAQARVARDWLAQRLGW